MFPQCYRTWIKIFNQFSPFLCIYTLLSKLDIFKILIVTALWDENGNMFLHSRTEIVMFPVKFGSFSGFYSFQFLFFPIISKSSPQGKYFPPIFITEKQKNIHPCLRVQSYKKQQRFVVVNHRLRVFDSFNVRFLRILTPEINKLRRKLKSQVCEPL